MPAQECIVTPPICVAAMPVDAVIPTGTLCSFRYAMY